MKTTEHSRTLAGAAGCPAPARWTTAEEFLLMDLYEAGDKGCYTISEISELLSRAGFSRTPAAVNVKLSRLYVSRREASDQDNKPDEERPAGRNS